MGFFRSPTSFRLNSYGDGAASILRRDCTNSTFDTIQMAMAPPHESHPALGHLMLLVFEAVMEVVCVSLPGYIVARQGMFDADKQKFLANLNVALFTPCLSTYLHKAPFLILIMPSFYETGFSIDSRQARRVRRYTSYLPHSNTRFLRSFYRRV